MYTPGVEKKSVIINIENTEKPFRFPSVSNADLNFSRLQSVIDYAYYTSSSYTIWVLVIKCGDVKKEIELPYLNAHYYGESFSAVNYMEDIETIFLEALIGKNSAPLSGVPTITRVWGNNNSIPSGYLFEDTRYSTLVEAINVIIEKVDKDKSIPRSIQFDYRGKSYTVAIPRKKDKKMLAYQIAQTFRVQQLKR